MNPAPRLERIEELMRELREYVGDRHDVDCVGDPPRFVSNAWGFPLLAIDEILTHVSLLKEELG